VNNKPTYLSKDGLEKLRAELEEMTNVRRPEIADRIHDAKEHGDLSENAEYHAQREAQGLLLARINKLKSDLARASIVDPSKLPTDQVAFGATVVVRDMDLDDEEEFTLVGSGDEDYDAGKYLITSPIGQGLLGKKVGDKVEIPVPRGVLKYEILAIRFDER
jgi:transcription elongation factor GreA